VAKFLGDVATCRVESRPPPQPIDGAEASRRNEPGSWIAWHSFRGPTFHRRDERVVERLLGEVEVAEETDERCQDAPRFSAVDRVDLLAQRGIDIAHDALRPVEHLDGAY